MTTPRPCRSLYVHVPFCRRRCGYCDFYSEILHPGAAAPLVDALLAELTRRQSETPCRLETIYVGGGTPTALPVNELERLLRGVRSARVDETDVEFTVEANPETVDAKTAGALARAGVNRVSLGAQSFEQAELDTLDREHRPRRVGDALATCRQAGILNLSLDLIFGIPGQTLLSWKRSLLSALELRPQHLSCYGLTYEPGTRLKQQLDSGLIEPVDEDTEAAMYETAIDTLTAAGLEHYEISNFAAPGARCRHNVLCWHNEPYIGVGPSAAGFVDGLRYKNTPDIGCYVRDVSAGTLPQGEWERLSPERRPGEAAMLELRLIEGIDRNRFRAHFERDPLDLFPRAIDRHVAAGLLEVNATHVRLTRAGLLLADTVIRDLL